MRTRRGMVAAAALTTAVMASGGVASATPADTIRVAVIGDSITTGYGVPPGYGWADRFEARQAGDNIRSYAVNGATVRRWLQQYLPQLDTLPAWQPRTVVIALGANEWHMTRPAGEYADHLRQLIAYVHGKVPGAKVILLHYYQINAEHEANGCDAMPGDPVQCIHASPPDAWAAYGETMRQVAEQNGVRYIDISGTRNWSALQSADQAHLTAEGHRVFELDVRAALNVLP